VEECEPLGWYNETQDLADEANEDAKIRLSEIQMTTEAYETTKKKNQKNTLSDEKIETNIKVTRMPLTTTTEKVIRIEKITHQDETTKFQGSQCTRAKVTTKKVQSAKIEVKTTINKAFEVRETTKKACQSSRLNQVDQETTKKMTSTRETSKQELRKALKSVGVPKSGIMTSIPAVAPIVKVKLVDDAIKTSLLDIKDKLSKLTEAARKLKAFSTDIHKEYAEDPKSKICSKHKGHNIKLFRDPNSCTHFYQCHLGKPMLRECPDGLHFDDHGHTCQWQEIVKCNLLDNKRPENQDNAETKDAVRKSKGLKCRNSKHSFLWDDSSCRRYWKCEDNGEASELQCKQGQHFDMTSETCKHPNESDCRRRLLSKSRRGADHLSVALLSHFVSHN
jgi:Chitin binding Peritrophin-A domain